MEFTLVCSEILYSEKAVVYTYLSLLAVVGRYPMKCALNLAVGTFHTTLAYWIILSLNLNNVAISILGATSTLNDVSILQANLLAWSHTEELLRCILHKVSTFNPKVLRECYCVCSVCLVLRIIDSHHLLGLFLWIIGYYKLNWIEYSRYTQ